MFIHVPMVFDIYIVVTYALDRLHHALHPPVVPWYLCKATSFAPNDPDETRTSSDTHLGLNNMGQR